jgi:hypothetical protein
LKADNANVPHEIPAGEDHRGGAGNSGKDEVDLMTQLSAYFSSEEDLRNFIERGIRGIERWIDACGDAHASDRRDEAIRFNKKMIEKWQGIYKQRYGRPYAPELKVIQGGISGLEKPIRPVNS